VLFVVAAIAAACGGGRKQPAVPEGHHRCTYCCTTANIACSCDILDAVECPAFDNTGMLPACAECRTCTKLLQPGESCGSEQ
jgi:hypothetical protein